MSRRARACWRVVVLGLWLVSGLFPLLPPVQRNVLPPCCRANGKHQCALSHRPSRGKTAASVTASCAFNAPAKATGARLNALHSTLPCVRTRDAVVQSLVALSNELAPAAVIIRRASRAPPRLLV